MRLALILILLATLAFARIILSDDCSPSWWRGGYPGCVESAEVAG